MGKGCRSKGAAIICTTLNPFRTPPVVAFLFVLFSFESSIISLRPIFFSEGAAKICYFDNFCKKKFLCKQKCPFPMTAINCPGIYTMIFSKNTTSVVSIPKFMKN